MDDHREWKKMIYEAITNVSDLDFQRKSWLGNSPDFSFSFVETISTLYDDCFFVKFLSDNSWNEMRLSDDLRKEMNFLREMIDSYKELETHAAILCDPQWHRIASQAKKIITLFSKELNF